MSQSLSSGGSPFADGFVVAVDLRGSIASYRPVSGANDFPAAIHQWRDGLLWPNSRFGGVDCVVLTASSATSGVWWVDLLDSGGAQQKKIIGTTRDSTSAVLGNCIVQGFVTASEVFVGQVTSDSAGYFELPTPLPGAHYLVCYKTGSPDVAGTSVNTLNPV